MHFHLKTLTPLLALTIALTLSEASAMPNRAMGTAAPAPTAPQNPTVTVAGKVVETFKAGGYSYVAVAKGEQRMWVACSPIDIVVGQEVTFQPGFLMRNFTSGSLGRTFELIVFTQGLANPAAAVAAPAAK